MKKLGFILLLICSRFSYAQVLINEIASANLSTIADEDGEYPDWIEIFNAGPADVNLRQYAISDDQDIWNKWLFPDTILSPGERLLVFASQKNRNAFDAELASIDHWETAVYDDDIWEYFEGVADPDLNWNNLLFAGSWDTGKGGFGFGDDDDSTLITEGVRSVFYRKEFEVADKTKLIHAILNMDFDDGYMAFLNGVEIGAFGLTGVPAYDDLSSSSHEAQLYEGGSPDYVYLDSATLASILVNGTNVLAVEVHNKTAGSNDMSGRTFLSFAITDNSVYYGATPAWFASTPSSRLHSNFKIGTGETISFFDNTGILLDSITCLDLESETIQARIGDGGTWCITNTQTPDTVNTGLCYTEYSAVPIITPDAGFYTGDQLVTITGLNVKYTLDGTEPNNSSTDYTAPFTVSATTVVRAKCFETDKLPSPMVTHSLFIDEPTLLPVVSISATPCDLFYLDDSCLAAYDEVNDFNNENPQAKVTIEYFEADKSFGFSAETKFEAVGNYSIGLPQKGVQFTCDEDFNSPDDIAYQIYKKDKPGIHAYHAFRLRNTDNDSESTRMRDLIVNRFAMPTYNVAAGSQNVAAFINGEYWGHYVSRERLDPYFCRDNFGCDPASVDMIKTSFSIGGIGDYVAEAGTDTAFLNLRNYCVDHDLTIPENYNYVVSRVDEQNWADYYATEIYIANDDWIGNIFNNVRLFRATSPEVQWKFILWDLSYSQDGEWGTGPGSNSIDASLDDNNYYNDILHAMMDNPAYHDYFINRFADLMNYYYTPEIIHAIIDENTAEMITEMNAQDDRWNTGDSLEVLDEVQNLKDFHSERRSYQFDDIEDYFDLNGQVDITINVNPPGAGFIKISTIMPQVLPWTGIYFDGVPVTLTAVANPGFTFVNWDDNIFIDSVDHISFTNNITDSTSFTANFNGAAIPNPIVISEINYNCDSTFNTGDWIELHNTSLNEIDLTDYTFSDKIFYNDFKLPTGTKIEPNGYLVIAEDIDEFSALHPGITNIAGSFNFNLQNDGDSITLLDHSGNMLAAFSFNDKRPWPVTADNYGRTMELISDFADPALAASWFAGCIGGSPGAPFSPCNENPLVDEINYHSSDAEDAGDWFEIYNYSAGDMDLSGWTVKDKNGNAYTIPDGTIIPADNYLVVYQDETKFTAQFPGILNKTGPAVFGLSSLDDIISVYDQTGRIYQSVCYDNEAPYPLSPDGGGTALQIISVTENINDGTNWMESCPEGSPGEMYTFPCNEETTENADEFISELTVYPNPADQIIRIVIPSEITGESELSLYDMAGRKIMTLNPQNSMATLTISDLTSGLYFIKLHSEKGQYNATFMKE